MIVFALTLALSAFLLFAIQPLFAKMVLPILGGSTSVWAVALFFYQTALLFGYLYAHIFFRWFSIRFAGGLHLGFLAFAALFLPISIENISDRSSELDPYIWQLALFASAIGLPFIVLSANAPLLQAWFSHSGYRQRNNPYFLYAASNFGSFAALIGYPTIFEPALGVKALSNVWTAGFVALWFFIALCYWLVFRTRRALQDGGELNLAGACEPAAQPSTSWRRRLGWITLGMVPTALLSAYTTHVTTDVASAPFLWVIPLALYLLTFVIAFQERVRVPINLLRVVHTAAVLLALLALTGAEPDDWIWIAVPGVAAFFLGALVAHLHLYKLRPGTDGLTEYYLLISLGGALGGLFSALIAPKLFSEAFEYPILLALTVACHPNALRLRLLTATQLIALLLLLGGSLIVLWSYPILADVHSWRFFDLGTTAAATATFALVAIVVWRTNQLLFVSVACAAAAIILLPSNIYQGNAQRSYFGIYRIKDADDGRRYRALFHGTTLHGVQELLTEDEEQYGSLIPGSYYYPQSPMADTIKTVRSNLNRKNKKGRYAVVGLGIGSLACYAKPGERWHFYEIDPLIAKIATDPKLFTFVQKCQPNLHTVIGDARLTLAKVPKGHYDLIIVDAFSSDSVPVHLLTAEALKMYTDRLSDDGILVLHISNKYLDLDAVVSATIPLVPGLKGLLITDDWAEDIFAALASDIALIAKNSQALKSFQSLVGTRQLMTTKLRGWTDDHSDLITPFLMKRRDG